MPAGVQFRSNSLPMPSYQFLIDPTCDQMNQIVALYQEARWWSSQSDNHDLVKRIIKGSHCFCVAWARKRIVGMGRSISDGVSDAYIQDVVVSESFRGLGIGTHIVRYMIQKLEADGILWIGLIAEQGAAGFYRPLGFNTMPNSTPMLRLRQVE